jgi:FkbM family methyltransferase
MAEGFLNNFTVIESVYGKFLVNRNCTYQAEALIKTGRPHIDNELRKILIIVDSLPGECLVVDAGANIGLLSIPIAGSLKGRGGTLHAFEPQRMMFYALCGSAALNDLDNLHVHHAALGRAPGRIGVAKLDYGQPQDFGMLSLTGQLDDRPKENVPLLSLDALNLPRLDFLKIDVEGMEIEVLRGARSLVARERPWCWVEYWKIGIEPIRAEFTNLGYKFYVMDELNLLCAPPQRLAGSQFSIQAPEA